MDKEIKYDVAGYITNPIRKRFYLTDGDGDGKYVNLTFREWIKELCDWGDYDFLLDGYQTGEIFDLHEFWAKGIDPQAAACIEYNEFARI